MHKPEYDINSKNPLYLIIKCLLGRLEKTDGSSDRFLVVDEGNKEVMSVFDKLWKFVESEIDRLMKSNDKITFGAADNKVRGYNKLRFSSDIDLPVNTLTEFHALTVVINCVIEKDGRFIQRFIWMNVCMKKT